MADSSSQHSDALGAPEWVQAAQSAVLRAYAQGRLYAHMLEFSHQAVMKKPDFFDVMAGVPGTEYNTTFHAHVHAAAHGFTALPTTVMKQGLPVTLFDLKSCIGLLFDGNALDYVKPVLISSEDVCSTRNWEEGRQVMRYSPETRKRFAAMRADQEKNVTTVGLMGAEIFTEAHVATVRETVDKFWDTVETMGWRRYVNGQRIFEGMNEADILAHIKGLKGMIVYTEQVETTESAKNAAAAQELAGWLRQRYPEAFPEPPPVFAYHLRKKTALLHPMSPEELASPLAYFERPRPQHAR